MEIHEVNIVNTQASAHAVDGLQCLTLTVLIRPQLACNPNLGAVNAAVLHSASHTTFVLIGMCRVDMAVAALQRCHHRIVGLVTVGNAIHSESELWHLYSIVQRQIRLLHLSVHNHCCHQCD